MIKYYLECLKNFMIIITLLLMFFALFKQGTIIEEMGKTIEVQEQKLNSLQATDTILQEEIYNQAEIRDWQTTQINEGLSEVSTGMSAMKVELHELDKRVDE